jgi:hypothetical protein
MLKKGDPIATNTTLVGREQNVLKAPRDSIVLGVATLPAVSPGDPVCNLAFPTSDAFDEMRTAIDRLPADDLLSRLHDDLSTNVLVTPPGT